MHTIYTRGARRMGLGQEINWTAEQIQVKKF